MEKRPEVWRPEDDKNIAWEGAYSEDPYRTLAKNADEAGLHALADDCLKKAEEEGGEAMKGERERRSKGAGSAADRRLQEFRESEKKKKERGFENQMREAVDYILKHSAEIPFETRRDGSAITLFGATDMNSEHARKFVEVLSSLLGTRSVPYESKQRTDEASEYKTECFLTQIRGVALNIFTNKERHPGPGREPAVSGNVEGLFLTPERWKVVLEIQKKLE